MTASLSLESNPEDIAAKVKLRLADIKPMQETATPVTDALFNRIPSSALSSLLDSLNEAESERLAGLKKRSPQNYRRRVLQLGIGKVVPGFEKTGLVKIEVPETIHSVVGANQPAGDFFACDMFVEALAAAGVSLKRRKRILDFGASSGRVIRNLAVYYPKIACEACDPRQETVEWAKANIPNVEYYVSQPWPELPVQDRYYNAVYAGSVWSHFSERAALAWFEEMLRVIVPGGVLVFTSHGYPSVGHFTRKANQPPEEAFSNLEQLDAGQFAFKPYGAESLTEDLDDSNWGISYIPRQWIAANLEADWEVLLLQEGRLLMNQDVYVLRRRRNSLLTRLLNRGSS